MKLLGAKINRADPTGVFRYRKNRADLLSNQPPNINNIHLTSIASVSGVDNHFLTIGGTSGVKIATPFTLVQLWRVEISYRNLPVVFRIVDIETLQPFVG